MRAQVNLVENVQLKGYPPLVVNGLDGQFCAVCGDGFWSFGSERAMSRLLAEHTAQVDSERIVAAELASVQEAASAMKITVQGVHKMMRDGRLRYVYAAGKRFPIRAELAATVKRMAEASSGARAS